MALSLFSMPQLYSPIKKPNVMNYGNKHFTQISCDSASTQNIGPHVKERRSANYKPSSWSYNFIQSLKIHNIDEMQIDKARKLEEEVRCLLNNGDAKWLAKLELIDEIQRLGLGHRFDKDIQDAFDRFVSTGGFNVIEDKSLHAITLSFRLLRQHGYEVSQEVFKDFMNAHGDIEAKCLKVDNKGALSMYEASFLACEGEDFLDKGKAWSRSLLLGKEIQGSKNQRGHMGGNVHRALELPLHRRPPLLEARLHIEEYDQNKDAIHALALLAKLNFNIMQSVLQSDLKHMSRWWNDMGLARKLTFSRDRLMECFFWAVGMTFEPHLSSCRKGLTKVASFITIIDDIYDVYGTLDELELFTKAVDRWDTNAVNGLPDYMKLCFLAFYNTINEMAFDSLKERGENVIPFLTKAWADLLKAFLQEAKWSQNKRTPSFNEYLENAWRSVSGTVLLAHAYFLTDHSRTGHYQTVLLEDCLLVNYHDLLRLPSIIFRLCNDLATSSAELERGETINAITCYMNENGVSEEIAREHMHKLIDEAWKKMNKLVLVESNKNNNSSPFAKCFVQTVVNLVRIAHCSYQHEDGHGDPGSRTKKRVFSLLIEPIPTLDF